MLFRSNDTATTEIYTVSDTLSLHDALPIFTTVPHALALYFSRLSPDLVIARPPFDIAGFDLKQHWHRKYHNDSRNQWLRKQVAQLFNDESDEWKADWQPPARSVSSAR